MVKGNDLSGVVLSVGGVSLPVHLLFCPKLGRANTNKPDLLIKMLSDLKDEFLRPGVDITEFPLTMDSWFASAPLKRKLHAFGFQRQVFERSGDVACLEVSLYCGMFLEDFKIDFQDQIHAVERRRPLQRIADQGSVLPVRSPVKG